MREKELKDIDKKFAYDGGLGSFAERGGTTFRLWSPLAASVLLNIYEYGDGDSLADAHGIPMVKRDGVWEYFSERGLDGMYYTYTVDGTETADPYARTGGLNGARGMIVDFSAADVSPDGWEGEHEAYLTRYGLESYTDAVIWETHIRDFSGRLRSAKYKGKYLAFTEDLVNELGQRVGVGHLTETGFTHVHILPINEYSTVDQSRLGEAGYNAFNWGYDPYSHNMPSGVYSENPRDGKARVREVREMVAALHAAGIGVILDVVYNHTYDFNCPLGRTFKEYYYRRNERGGYTDGSGCGNELASENAMCRKYIIDSLLYWAKEYHIDGFRFDLMAVIDIDTMRLASEKLHELNPNIMLYGEGWTGGASGLAPARQSSKYNITKPEPAGVGSVAVFSDTVRDAVKGEVFIGGEGGYINGRAWENVERIKFSVMGGTSPNFNVAWQTASAAQCINYVSAHDNLTLWDKIFLTGAGQTYEERLRMNKMAAAIYFTCQGVPFMQGGEELMRSKPDGDGFDHNSYKSSDEVNNIRWSRLRVGSASREVSDYYRGLIAFRKAHAALRLSDAAEIEGAISFVDTPLRYDIISFRITARGEELFIVYNPLISEEIALPEGDWALCVSGEFAGAEGISVHSGKVNIKGLSVYVFCKVS